MLIIARTTDVQTVVMYGDSVLVGTGKQKSLESSENREWRRRCDVGAGFSRRWQSTVSG